MKRKMLLVQQLRAANQNITEKQVTAELRKLGSNFPVVKPASEYVQVTQLAMNNHS